MQNLLRWLLRRGSPLPIPNREVKPDCADGTAVMWESMSSPFFENPILYRIGFFVFIKFTILFLFQLRYSRVIETDIGSGSKVGD